MTSFVFPVASWCHSPSGAILRAVASENGKHVVTVLDGGRLWINSLDPVSAKLEPTIFLVGHRSPISALLLCKIEVDGPATDENIIISASEDGEVIMWDIGDGRALQANPKAYPGVPTSVAISTSRKSFVCGGQSSVITILDSSNLEVVATVNILDNWSSALTLRPTEFKALDEVWVVTPEGNVKVMSYDESKPEILLEPKTIDLMATVPVVTMLVQLDMELIGVLDRKTFWILSATNAELMMQITCPDSKSMWEGVAFLSDAVVLLWTKRGTAYTYLVDTNASAGIRPVQEIREPRSVLLTDGEYACVRSRMPPPNDADRKPLSTFCGQLNGGLFSLCLVPSSSPQSRTRLLAFRYVSGQVNASMWSFFLKAEAAESSLKRSDSSLISLKKADSSPALLPADGIMFKNPTPLSFTLGELQSYESNVCITSAVMLTDKSVALGLGSGEICITTVAAAVLCTSQSLRENSSQVLRGHVGPVTALLRPPPDKVHGKSFLVSGGEDGAVAIWNVEEGIQIASFSCHSARIESLQAIPPEAGLKSKFAVLSICRNNSLSIFHVDDFRHIFTFTGHEFPPMSVHWRHGDEIMAVQCADEDRTSYVWMLKTGHLDRIETREMSDDVISGCEGKVINVPFKTVYLAWAMSSQTPASSRACSPILFALLVNLKRLINDVYSNQQPLSPPVPLVSKSSNSPDRPPNRSRVSSPNQPAPPATVSNLMRKMTLSSRQVSSMDTAPGPAKNVHQDRAAGPNPLAQKIGATTGSSTSLDSIDVGGPGTSLSDVGTVQAVLSAALSWSGHPVEGIYVDRLGLKKPAGFVSTGMRGANGYLSILAPAIANSRQEWSISPSFTCIPLAASAVFIQALDWSDEDIRSLVSFYTEKLANFIGPQFSYPSFSFVAKYWQDQISDVQWAARHVFSSYLVKLPKEERTSLVEYWRPHLPALAGHSKKTSKTNLRAAIILGIVGSEQPSLLSNRICKDVAESLDILLREDARGPYRTVGIELISRGFATWEPHLNSSAIVRTIIASTGLSTPSGRDGTGDAGNPGPPGPMNLGLMQVARQAVVQIASLNPGLFISTITLDVAHAKSPSDRIGALKLLGMFISKKPLVILGYLGKIVEAMVKSLDPNVPTMREVLQPIITANFAELVKMYPSVSFHHGSQKLAVGTPEGVTIVYDLKTATRVHILEAKGTQKSVTAVSYSPDGKLIATFSLEENCVRFWQTETSFLNTLAGAFMTSGNSGAASAVGHMKSFREFSVGPRIPSPNANVLRDVRFEWVSDRSVKLMSIQDTQLVFTV
ncbi:hypothetical protein DFJ73DRAFT_845096 [Zopfochytrium polystomum]|nr:hypothetical protein DFJ73DRAFT_845096 [Zopfochytrium polystomum]